MKKICLLSIFFILIGLLTISCENGNTDPTVTYEVTTNNNNFEISYLDENGQNIQELIKENYWTTSFIGKKGDFVSLSIQANKINDKIEAKIIYDGKIIKEVVTYGQMSDKKVSAEISTKIPY